MSSAVASSQLRYRAREYTRSLCESNRRRKACRSPFWQATKSTASSCASVTAGVAAGADSRVISRNILGPGRPFLASVAELVVPAHPFLPFFLYLSPSGNDALYLAEVF